MSTLLPEQQQQTVLQQRADRVQEQQLSRQVIALVGATSPELAFSQAKSVASLWQQSRLFQQVESEQRPDFTRLRHEMSQLSLALLPQDVRHQLLTRPRQYFQQYAQQLADPFAQRNLLPLEQDWLGFGRFVLIQAQQFSTIQWHPENAMLYTQQEGMTWVLLRGILPPQNVMNVSRDLLSLMAKSRRQAVDQQVQLLVTGTALFAAEAKQQAERESLWMSLLGVSLTLLLLFGVFRTFRVLWLFLPILLGMAAGVAVTVSVFGHIHILTLVVGTSLIGVLIDFPLHWLSSSLFTEQWRAEHAMRGLKRTFLLSLSVTLLGYGLLWFTFLPVLKQTALFSAVALLCTVSVTLSFLPRRFQSYSGSDCRPPKFKPCRKLSVWTKSAVVFCVVFFVGVGLYRSQWRDDMRQWIAIPQVKLSETKRIAQLTGMDLSSQYLLLTAADNEQLLMLDQRISEQLNRLQAQHKLAGFSSLSQWMMPEAAQRDLTMRLQRLTAQDFMPLVDLGVPLSSLQQAVSALVHLSTISLTQGLNTDLGKARRNLYLGEIAPHCQASIIRIHGLQDPQAVIQLADQKQVFWQDKTAQLNRAFEDTRNQAAWLKVISFAVAGLLLCRFFGVLKTAKMLLIPGFAILTTVGILGWLQIPVSLFAMFGLLLVSAIGIDYTAYMQTAEESLVSKRIAVILAALTTLISFVLLSLSATPAVAAFGLSVSLGVALSLFATLLFLR
ncbi:hypothetical protein P7L91_10775 [Bisgaard Taxon 10/6]|nr:hypothetical protein [Exercitatus varius]MDG2961318.1 hypothetical protein [Exercitatus varius]